MNFLPHRSYWSLFLLLALLPVFDLLLPQEWQIAALFRPIFILAILGLGLNVVTGYTGMLNLGVAGFMAVGAYSFSILSCDIYPFQLSFISAVLISAIIGGAAGVLLGLPTTRLSGDYLAIVTLGFGEIIQALLRNLESITKGTQGINPLPAPAFFGYTLDPAIYHPWYYLFLLCLAITVLIVHNLRYSRLGRTWIAIRGDEIASTCVGIPVPREKLYAFALGSSICTVSGTLWASYLGSSTEPSNFDFQISILALCIVIVGGMGTIRGVVLGAIVVVGFNTILLEKLSSALLDWGLIDAATVYFKPSNWKYAIFGFALVFMMRWKPDGLFSEEARAAR